MWERIFNRIKYKIENGIKILPKAISQMDNDAKVGIISSGSAHFAVEEAREQLKNQGIKTNYLRIRSLPLGDEVREFLEQNDQVFVVELNRDGQLHQLITLNSPDMAFKNGQECSHGWFAIDRKLG